jgi:hypothetical protein
MSVVMKTLQEFLGAFVQHGVVGDLVGPVLQFRLNGQLAEQDQVGDFEKGALLGELLDRITAITQDTLIAIYECDRALAGNPWPERRPWKWGGRI